MGPDIEHYSETEQLRGRAASELSGLVRFAATSFGDILDFQVPADCGLVVLCVDRHQHYPVAILLPHQVYREHLRKLRDEYPDATGFTVMPVRCSEKYSVPAKAI